MENKNILITGANGFIGQTLCNAFSKAGYQVRGVVRKKKPSAISINWELLEVGDFSENFDWGHALTGIDVVIHTAARVHQMKESLGNPHALYKRVNTDTTLEVLKQAHQYGVRRFIFLSSIKVNGESTTTTPFSETDPAAPQDPYAISKYEAEEGIQNFCQHHPEISCTIFRLPLVYGVGVKANFAALLRAVQRRYPLPFGAVHNKRSLLYLGNLLSILQADMQQDQIKNQVYLLSDGDDISSATLVQTMAAAYGVQSFLLPIPPSILLGIGACLGKAKAMSRLLGSLQVDSKKVRTSLQWSPPYTVASGLTEMAMQARKN